MFDKRAKPGPARQRQLDVAIDALQIVFLQFFLLANAQLADRRSGMHIEPLDLRFLAQF